MTASRASLSGMTAATIAAVGAAVWGTRHATARAVRQWQPGGGTYRRAGALHVRRFGSGETVVLLLHGMAAAGNSFGAAFDRLGDSAQVVVPDLLGFGGSMVPPGTVSGEDHLEALASRGSRLDAGRAGHGPVAVGRRRTFHASSDMREGATCMCR